MSNDWGIGDAISRMMIVCALLIVFALPLAVWKAVEIFIWVYHHVHVGITP